MQREIFCENLKRNSQLTYSEDRIAFEVEKALTPGSLWGYMDKGGHIVVRPKYHWAEEFRNGLAFVIFLNEDGKYGKSAIVNKLGEVVSPPGFLMQNFYGDYGCCFGI